jgi:hypothetical protein
MLWAVVPTVVPVRKRKPVSIRQNLTTSIKNPKKTASIRKDSVPRMGLKIPFPFRECGFDPLLRHRLESTVYR